MLSDDELDSIPNDVDFLIIKTGYGKYRDKSKYHDDNPGLHCSLADKLKSRFSSLKVYWI